MMDCQTNLTPIQKAEDGVSTGPTLTVAVCTKGRSISLAHCLESVLEQSCLPVEIIVVDDGCLDPHLVADFEKRCVTAGVGWRYLPKNVPGLTRSRNLAVRHATGDVVQFLDDDVTLEPGFLEAIQSMYAADEQAAVGGADGRLIDTGPAGWGQRLYQLGYRLAGWWAVHPRRIRRPMPCEVLARRRGLKPIWNVVGATLSGRRSVLLEVPFDESLGGYALGEDRDWTYRAGRRYWILRNDRARAVHHHDPRARPDYAQLGRMTVRNYLYITGKSCDPGVGRWVVIAWTFAVLIGLHLLYSILGDRSRHLTELRGMCRAICDVSVWRNS